MKGFWSMVALVACFGTTSAQSNYNAALIPKELLSHANAVVRSDDENIEVKDIDNTLLHVKKAVTILNPHGEEYGELSLYYDKSDQVKNIKGAIYNDLGTLVSKFSGSDFSDESVADGHSLFNSTRQKTYRPSVSQYPYTVVYEYDI